MAITAGNWSSGTDPFILALAHSYTGSLGEMSSNRVLLYDTTGFLNGVVDDMDVQELYWSKDSDPEKTWFVNAIETLGTGPHALNDEVGTYDRHEGSNFTAFRPEDLFEADTKDARVYTTGKANGAVRYSLFAFTAYSWVQKDPAQIIFSWIAHHTSSAFTLKDFLNQASFQDASDYYDENPINLSCYREVGSTIAEQIKKLMDHTFDLLAIRPAESGGAMQLHIMPRQLGLTQRTTPISLGSKSLQSYVIRPTDKYTIDRLDIELGGFIFLSDDVPCDVPEKYDIRESYDIPGRNRTTLVQKVGQFIDDRTVEVSAPYHTTRGTAFNHMDIAPFVYGQDELELSFTDWTHLNFDVGDIVPISGGALGYDEEPFLVTEKILDLNDLRATARLIQVRVAAGKRPAYADSDHLQVSLTPNSLGDYFEANSAFPLEIANVDNPRNIDRFWDLSNEYAHVGEMDRGSPIAARLQVDAEVRERWPGIVNDGTMGGNFPYALGEYRGVAAPAVSDITAYFVINPDAANLSNPNYLFQQAGTSYDLAFCNGNIGSSVVQFYDGTSWRGTQAATGGWQILVFVLLSAGASIRRNGSVIESGLPYTQTRLLGASAGGGYSQSFLVADQGDYAHFKGEFLEMHIFNAGHNTATVEAIESHLADKYSI